METLASEDNRVNTSLKLHASVQTKFWSEAPFVCFENPADIYSGRTSVDAKVTKGCSEGLEGGNREKCSPL